MLIFYGHKLTLKILKIHLILKITYWFRKSLQKNFKGFKQPIYYSKEVKFVYIDAKFKIKQNT